MSQTLLRSYCGIVMNVADSLISWSEGKYLELCFGVSGILKKMEADHELSLDIRINFSMDAKVQLAKRRHVPVIGRG
jgi:hypothetical protein